MKTKTKRRKQIKYPWDRWLKRGHFRLVRGRDFRCRAYSMMIQVRQAAIARNLRVHVLIEGETLIVIRRNDK